MHLTGGAVRTRYFNDNLDFHNTQLHFPMYIMKLREPKKELERIKDYKEVIFWSFSRKIIKRQTGWPKTAKVRMSARS